MRRGKKHPRQVPADIYNMLRNRSPDPEVNVDHVIEQFGEEVKEALRNAVCEPEQDKTGVLRLSSIGRTDRQIWNDYNGSRKEAINGPTYIKFLYGHIIEAMVLALTQLSGHDVTDQQKECYVEGIKGHTDGKIDGVIMDVKSCSTYGFRKFEAATLPTDDPFGYVAQLRAYAHSEGVREMGWLALDKNSGKLCWLGYDLDNLKPELEETVGFDIEERCRDVKKLVVGPSPDACYPPVADGKSGNMKLQSGCTYCDYREHCWPGARGFYYSNKITWLTEVVREPKVPEIDKTF